MNMKHIPMEGMLQQKEYFMSRLPALLLLNATLLLLIAMCLLGFRILCMGVLQQSSFERMTRAVPPVAWHFFRGIGFIWMIVGTVFQIRIGDWDSMWPISSTPTAYWMLLPGWLTIWLVIFLPGMPGLFQITTSMLTHFQMQTIPKIRESYWPFVGAWCCIALLLSAASITVVW
jgi:hypothetical protein